VVNLEEYRTLFFVATLGLALVAASPALAMVVPFGGGSEELSEFWLLGPNRVAEDYPFNVSAGEMYSVFVGVGNHMGSSEYYKVYVKFGNSTQLDFNSSKHSSLSPLYEFRGFVGDGDFWESPVTFGFQNVSLVDKALSVDNVTMNASIEDAVLSVDEVMINGMVFPVDAHTSWDAESGGFYFHLSFELWRYDTVLKSFMFHNRIVGLRLNMTDT
jgi:hypothetical protein